MSFGAAAYGLAFVAGLLSILSPCVLPIVPIVLTSAAQAHRRGPLALAAGLAASFAVVGTGIAWAAGRAGFDATVLRDAGAVVLATIGVWLTSSSLQQRFATATAGVAGAGEGLLARLTLDDLRGQFVVGALLGLVWSPCVGPTLGAAIVVASQGRDLARIALLMGVFGLGAGLPLIALGMLTRQAMSRVRGTLLATGRVGKRLLGAGLILVALLILSGSDRAVETWLVDHSPGWLSDLTTRY